MIKTLTHYKSMSSIQLISPNFADILTPNIEIGKFPDGDSHVRIPQLASCKGQDVFIYHRLYPDQNSALIEILLILDALKYQGAKTITVVAPYMPYARQDKQTVDGEIASAHVICNILARAGCSKVITFDCHFLNEEGEAMHGELLIHNISMRHELIAYAKQQFADEPFEVIGPDDGAAYLVKDIGGKNLKKVRKGYDGNKIAYRNIDTMAGDFDVKDKNILLLDDMISSGSTMITALEKMAEGGVKRVACAATHGLFLFNCVDRLRKRSDIIFAADTIISPLAQVSIKSKLDNLFSKS
jgi:ribose-phosphate pyrophosphokinase